MVWINGKIQNGGLKISPKRKCFAELSQMLSKIAQLNLFSMSVKQANHFTFPVPLSSSTDTPSCTR